MYQNPSIVETIIIQILPNDIILDIFAKLPVKSLVRFKSVCRSWYSLSKDENFVQKHYETHKNSQKYFMISKGPTIFHHYTMDVPQLDSSSIISLVESPVPIDKSRKVFPSTQCFSSNGIILITYGDNKIMLWNPATRESRTIPSPIWSKTCGIYNFCCFPRIQVYKIFRLGLGINTDDMNIDIFSTKSNIWKSIGIFPRNYNFLGGNVVMVDGIVYMMAKRKDNLSNHTILRFCLEKEKFQDELLFQYTILRRTHFLYSLGEKLCLIRLLDGNREFWLYMNERNSWNKILTIPLTPSNCLRPLSFMKDGGMMFMKDGGMMFKKKDSFEFVAYNSTTHKLEQVNVDGIKGLHFNKVITYTETLSSLYL